MFTSRAEYRLLLRQDNADIRLMEKGYSLGLINETQFDEFRNRMSLVERELERIRTRRLQPDQVNPVLKRLGTSLITESASMYQLLKRPEVTYRDLLDIEASGTNISDYVISQVEIQTKYKGYILRQTGQAEKFKKAESRKIPDGFQYSGIHGLSREIVEKLEDVRPVNLGQAGRIPGVTPAAVSLLMVALERCRR